jgi:hypothetical protein
LLVVYELNKLYLCVYLIEAVLGDDTSLWCLIFNSTYYLYDFKKGYFSIISVNVSLKSASFLLTNLVLNNSSLLSFKLLLVDYALSFSSDLAISNNLFILLFLVY